MIPIVLSIAGFDPSSGAGVTADVKTIAAHGCYAISCITALTVQSTRAVLEVFAVPPLQLRSALEELSRDLPPNAVKIGMLGAGDVAKEVADYVERHCPPNLVLDPILISSTGTSLIDEEALAILKNVLLPRARVATPNVEEASVLTGMPVCSPVDMRSAAAKLHEMGAQIVVIKGGHLAGSECMDLLSFQDDNGLHQEDFSGPRMKTRATHGTGCAFSSALACNLALGKDIEDAVAAAKQYVRAAMARAYPLGAGLGPLNHLYRL
ncbi:MAG: bifunctional hydroxymethylpyrimidine kinase/phosphomethylpyrimidine kinase [Terriglobales bacterium]